MKCFKLSLLLIIFCCLNSKAQTKLIELPTAATLVKINYGFYYAGADLANRYGNHAVVGLACHRKTPEGLSYGLNANVIFGSNVDAFHIIDDLVNKDGFITGTDGLQADISILMRGIKTGLTVGKTINVLSNNPNSGILIEAGLGYLQHKIRYEDIQNTVPQFDGEYVKVYDRLTSGIYLEQFIGYQYLDKRRLINFYAGLNIIEGFTKNRRTVNFNTVEVEGNRLDISAGFKVGWIIPFYSKSVDNDRYYID